MSEMENLLVAVEELRKVAQNILGSCDMTEAEEEIVVGVEAFSLRVEERISKLAEQEGER